MRKETFTLIDIVSLAKASWPMVLGIFAISFIVGEIINPTITREKTNRLITADLSICNNVSTQFSLESNTSHKRVINDLIAETSHSTIRDLSERHVIFASGVVIQKRKNQVDIRLTVLGDFDKLQKNMKLLTSAVIQNIERSVLTVIKLDTDVKNSRNKFFQEAMSYTLEEYGSIVRSCSVKYPTRNLLPSSVIESQKSQLVAATIERLALLLTFSVVFGLPVMFVFLNLRHKK